RPYGVPQFYLAATLLGSAPALITRRGPAKTVPRFSARSDWELFRRRSVSRSSLAGLLLAAAGLLLAGFLASLLAGLLTSFLAGLLANALCNALRRLLGRLLL